MVEELIKLNTLIKIAEDKQSPLLKFEFTINIVDQYFKDFFYLTNIEHLESLVEDSLKFYIISNLNDEELKVKLLLFQAALKLNKYDFEYAFKNLKKCMQFVQSFPTSIYKIFYHRIKGMLYAVKKMYQKSILELKKALSTIEETENGFEGNIKLYLDIYCTLFVCYFYLEDYYLAFNTYYKTIKLGKAYQVYEPVAKINTNFYSYCFLAGAHERASEAIALTRKLLKKNNSDFVHLFSIITVINKCYFENNYNRMDKLLERYKNDLLSPKVDYYSSMFFHHKMIIKINRKEYEEAFEYATQLCKIIKNENPGNYYLLLNICKICVIDEKYLKLISELPEYQKYEINYKLENLFRICIKYVDKQPKRDKINLYNFIIEYFKKVGFDETGLAILSDCINELQKITAESIKNKMIIFKQKYDATEKISEATELLEKQKKLTQFFKEFAYTAAHDLKAPLITIAEFAKIIKISFNDIPHEDAHEYLDIILETSQTMSKFINELIKYKGNDKEDLVKIYLEDIIKQVKINLYKDIEDSNCTIQIANKEFAFFSRRTPLEILFQNFISNAIKYRRKGVDLVVKIDITKNTRKVISVSDNGIGIPKEMQQKIFDPFFQIPNKKTVGCGIGLATCKRIIESFEGKIWLESIVNKGTTFYFTL